MILAALPVFTGLYAALVARRRPGAWWLAGCAIALVGEAVIVTVRTGAGAERRDARRRPARARRGARRLGGLRRRRDAAAARLLERGDDVLGRAARCGRARYRSAIVLLVRDGVPEADATAWGAVVFLAVVTSILGYVGWYWALDRGGIARIATLQFLQPLSGFALAAIVLDERADGADRRRRGCS